MNGSAWINTVNSQQNSYMYEYTNTYHPADVLGFVVSSVSKKKILHLVYNILIVDNILCSIYLAAKIIKIKSNLMRHTQFIRGLKD